MKVERIAKAPLLVPHRQSFFRPVRAGLGREKQNCFQEWRFCLGQVDRWQHPATGDILQVCGVKRPLAKIV